MIKMLQSEWTASAVGAIMYFLILAFSWHPPPAQKEAPIAASALKEQFILDPSHPELTQMIEELKTQKTALDQREARLNELAIRLQNEKEEITHVTNEVWRLQQRFDSSILVFRDAEAANLKKLAKTYQSMTPLAAAQTLKTMEDDLVAKILRSMKDADVAQIIDALTKLGPEAAKKATRLIERMRVAISDSVLPPPPISSNAAPAAAAAPTAAPAPAKTP